MTENDPRDYFSEVLAIIEQKSVRKNSFNFPHYTKQQMNWEAYKAQQWERFSVANPSSCDCDAMHALIHHALMSLDDGHSFFPSYYRIQKQDPQNPPVKIEMDTVPVRGQVIGNHAYLIIAQECPTGDYDAFLIDFSNQIKEIIKELDDNEIEGWIIDLRASYGGSIYGTLEGLSPLLPQNLPRGYFYENENENERVAWPTAADFEIETSRVELAHPHLPIAVLTGNYTSSAGEAIAIAFKGLPHARSFGQPTDGRSTGNATIPLSDGKIIALCGSIMGDRSGGVYGGPITPDFLKASRFEDHFRGDPVFKIFEKGYDPTQDETVELAREWLTQQHRAHPHLPQNSRNLG